MGNMTDDEFWELYKRVLSAKYVDVNGMPGLSAKSLIRPTPIAIVKSDGASWTRLYINRAVYLWSADGRRVDYISGHNPGDISGFTPKRWNSSVTGVGKLYTAGEWHVKTPVISGDVEGQMHPFIMSDAALGLDSGNVTAAEIAGMVAGLNSQNIKQIGGVDQTGLDLTGGLAPLVWGDASDVTVNDADVSILPANASRRGFSIYNNSAGAQVIAVGVTNPMVALRGIWVLNPGVGEVVGWKHPGFTKQGLRAWGSAAAGVITIAEAT